MIEDKTGFCTIFDETFNFEIKNRNEISFEIICTDNDRSSLSNIITSYFNNKDKTERRQTNSPSKVKKNNDNYTGTVCTKNAPTDRQPLEIINSILQTNLLVKSDNIYHLDYETTPIYNIRITCNDFIQHFTISENFSIDVIDINESPAALTLLSNILTENFVNKTSSLMIIGQICINNPITNENFTITFDQPNFQTSKPTTRLSFVRSDDGSALYVRKYTIIRPMTTTTASLSHALHIRIYETALLNTPIVRGILSSSTSNNTISNSTICNDIDNRSDVFSINTNQSVFIVLLLNNYTLTSTIHSTILLHVYCKTTNEMNVNQDIVIDVLPAPPTIQIIFNQTQPFYATNNISNDTILGHFYPIKLTTISINRTYNLLVINNQDISHLLPNGSLIQVGPYPSNFLESVSIHVNLTIEPTRIIQTFRVSMLVNSTLSFITFCRSSIPNTIIGNLTAHNITIPYRLHLLDLYKNDLELNPIINAVTLKRSINTLSLIKIVLLIRSNQTILNTTFPLTIIYSTQTNSCLNKDYVNGTCISLNEISSDCLCTTGYTSLNCKTIDSCLCLPNHSGSLCGILIDVRQLNTLINTNLTKCISKDELPYFIFRYLNDYKKIDILNDETLPEKIEDLIKMNLSDIDNIVLPGRRVLGPYKFNRKELISVGIYIFNNNNNITLNNALEMFCTNQSLIIDLFSREICSGYQQATYLNNYFKYNCIFIDAADKCYWFDETILFLPLWITLIIATLLLTIFLLILFKFNRLKKVPLPLIKSKMYPEDVDKVDEDAAISIKSVRSIGKISRDSYRERNDSGYESVEDSENYLEQIINNYRQQEHLHVYPVLHRPRSPSIEHRRSTIDDSHLSDSSSRSQSISSSNLPSHYTQESSFMSADRNRRRSSTGHSQTLQPINRHRSALLNSSLGTLVNLLGTPRLHHDDDTYVSSKLRNAKSSKFVIGTLWNTFALVNNLFLQRPRERRNALVGDTNLQADQLARLQQLYSLAEPHPADELSTHRRSSLFTEALSESQSDQINHLQSAISDILLSNEDHRCTCFGNHHIPSCIYYDHSLPYLGRSIGSTSHLEQVFYDIRKFNKLQRQDVSTQSGIKKPPRLFIHSKPANNVATQSSPILTLTKLHYNVSTQCSPKEDDDDGDKNIDAFTQTIANQFRNTSTQFSPQETKNNDHINRLDRIQPITNIYDDHPYVNVSSQFSPDEMQDSKPNLTNSSIQVDSKTLEDNNNNIGDRRNILMNELKEFLTSSTLKEQVAKEKSREKNSTPNPTVRSLVTMFETKTPPLNKLNFISSHKSSVKPPVNESNISMSPDSTVLNLSNEQPHLSIVNDRIGQYANEMASNIVDDAVLTVATTPSLNEKQQRRFSLYNSSGGHGKSLLFRSNTFVPPTGVANQERDQHFQVESHASSTLINESLVSPAIPNESRHTLIVGHHINGDDSHRSRRKNHHSLTHNINYDSSSLSSTDDIQTGHRQFLSNSQLFCAQALYIQPWLIRRATAPDIHCLNNDITNTHVETMHTTNTFFTVFPRHCNFDLYTRYTCLLTILLYLHDIHDKYSNGILYDELNRIEKQLTNPTLIPPVIHSNVFETTNPDGSKRYRTGFVLDINSSESPIQPKFLAKQIDWKSVKITTRRFRKKYQRYKQLIKNDKKKNSNGLNIENYLKSFDSTSIRRMKKYAKHYAEKV